MSEKNTWVCPKCGKRREFNMIPVFDTTGKDASDKSNWTKTLLECKGCGHVERIDHDKRREEPNASV